MTDRDDIQQRAEDEGEHHPEMPPHYVDPTTTGGGLGEPAVGDLPGADYTPPAEHGERARIEEAERAMSPGDQSIQGLESARDADGRSPAGDAAREHVTGTVAPGAEPSLVDRIASSAGRMFGGATHDGGGTGAPSDRVDARASVEGRRALDTEGPDPEVADRVRNPGED